MRSFIEELMKNGQMGYSRNPLRTQIDFLMITKNMIRIQI